MAANIEDCPAVKALERMRTDELAKEAALRWQLTNERCTQCDSRLFAHLALVPLGLGYSRCPVCRLNHVQRNATGFRDDVADAMLDALVRRLPSLLLAKIPETPAT